MMRLFEKLKTQPHFIAFCMSIVILLIDLPSAFAQTKSGNVDGLATKLPSKTVLQMGLSAKDSKSAPKSSQQNSAIKPKPRPEAKWGKSKDPVNIKGNRTKTESKSNKISTSKIYPAPKATVKPQNPTSNRPSLTKPASLPKPVGQVSQPIKKLPEPITEAKKLKTTSTPERGHRAQADSWEGYFCDSNFPRFPAHICRNYECVCIQQIIQNGRISRLGSVCTVL